MQVENQQIGEATPKFQVWNHSKARLGPTEGSEQDLAGLSEGSESPGETFPAHPWVCTLWRFRDAPGCVWWLRIHQQGAQTAAVPWAELFPRRLVQPREFYPKNILKIFIFLSALCCSRGKSRVWALQCLALGVSALKIPFFGNTFSIASSSAFPSHLFLGSSSWSIP